MTKEEELEERLRKSGMAIFDGDHRFMRMMGAWTCVRCGCRMQMFKDGSVKYRVRKLFARIQSTPPPCFLHRKSKYESNLRRYAQWLPDAPEDQQ